MYKLVTEIDKVVGEFETMGEAVTELLAQGEGEIWDGDEAYTYEDALNDK